MNRKTAIFEFIQTNRAQNPDIVTLRVGNREDAVKPFYLHRTLLRLSSQKFRDILIPNNTVFEVNDVRPNDFLELVKHIYMCSDWEFNGNLLDAAKLLKAAVAYGLEEFAHKVQTQIAESPLEDPRSVCYIFDVTRTITLDNGRLKNVLLSYILANAKLILSEDSFLHLSLESLLEIIRDYNLAVDSELDVYKAVVRWGMHSLLTQPKVCFLQNLQEKLKIPMQCIRFPLMTSFERENYVQPMGLLSQSSLASSLARDEVPHQNLIRYQNRPRRCIRPIEDVNAEPTVEETLRAELYISQFKSQVEATVLKATVEELHEDLEKTKTSIQEEMRRALAAQASSSKSEMDSLREGIARVQQNLNQAKSDAIANIAAKQTQMEQAQGTLKTELETKMMNEIDQLRRESRTARRGLQKATEICQNEMRRDFSAQHFYNMELEDKITAAANEVRSENCTALTQLRRAVDGTHEEMRGAIASQAVWKTELENKRLADLNRLQNEITQITTNLQSTRDALTEETRRAIEARSLWKYRFENQMRTKLNQLRSENEAAIRESRNTSTADLQEAIRNAAMSQDQLAIELESQIAAETEARRSEVNSVQSTFRQRLEQFEKLSPLNIDWGCFLSKSNPKLESWRRLYGAESILVVIQNNTAVELQNPMHNPAQIHHGLPDIISPKSRVHFGVNMSPIAGNFEFTYGFRHRRLQVRFQMDFTLRTILRFALGFERNPPPGHAYAHNDELLYREFWSQRRLDNSMGGEGVEVGTQQFGDIILRGSRAANTVLQILIFQSTL